MLEKKRLKTALYIEILIQIHPTDKKEKKKKAHLFQESLQHIQLKESKDFLFHKKKGG